jgi:hypothetical protein
MDVRSIQGLMRKLQVHEEKVNEIQEDVGAQVFFSKQDDSGYSQGGKGHKQSRERKARGRFGRGGRDSLNKSTGQPVTLTLAIRDPGLTNQKLNAIICKRHVIMLGIA